MNYEHNKDYEFFDFTDENEAVKTGIKILEGKYKDVSYSYGLVSAEEVEETNEAKLSFQYMLLTSPLYKFDELRIDEEFRKLMGDILSDIILKSKFLENDEDEKT